MLGLTDNVKKQHNKEALLVKFEVSLNTSHAYTFVTEKVTASKIDPCGVCGRRVKVNAVFCTNCARWVHGRCISMKRVTPGLAKNFVCKSCTTLDKMTWNQLRI